MKSIPCLTVLALLSLNSLASAQDSVSFHIEVPPAAPAPPPDNPPPVASHGTAIHFEQQIQALDASITDFHSDVVSLTVPTVNQALTKDIKNDAGDASNPIPDIKVAQAKGDIDISKVLRATAKAVGDVATGAGTTFAASGGISLERQRDSTVSLWSNVDFRNSYDKVQEVSTWVAPALGAVSLFFAKSDPNTAIRIAGSGAGIMGIANLLQSAFGGSSKDSVNKAARLLEFAELSRQAFDDANARARGVNVAYVHAKEVLSKLLVLKAEEETLEDKIDNNQSISYTDLEACVSKTVATIDDFRAVTDFVEVYCNQLLQQYDFYESTYVQLHLDFGPQRKAITDFLHSYDELIKTPFLNQLPSLKTKLLSFHTEIQVYMNALEKRKTGAPNGG